MAAPDLNTLLAAEKRWMPEPGTGEISLICSRPGFGQRRYPDALHLDTISGVEGDRWQEHGWLRQADGTADPRIQVAVIRKDLLDLLWPGGFADDAPYPGDTMVADLNLDSTALPAGTRLKAGSALLEVSDVFNDGCVKWKVRYGEDAWRFTKDKVLLPRRRRGMFCRIVASGTVRPGDRLIPV